MTHARPTPGAGFTHLLLVWPPGDHDPNLLPLAGDLADQWGAVLTVLVTLEPPQGLARLARAAGTSVESIESRLIAEEHERLSAHLQQICPDRDLRIAVRMGKPFIEIIHHVLAHGCDLVLKTAEEMPGLARGLFASTDQHLLRKCPCPVWLRQRDDTPPFKTIVAAVDVDDASEALTGPHADLNASILDTALRLAIAPGAVVHVLHVWDAPGEGLVRLWSDAPDLDKAVADYVTQVQTTQWQALDHLVAAARHRLLPQTTEHPSLAVHMERGAPRTVIPQQVDALQADLLVMGTIARTGVPGFIIGNTAEDVLNSVTCSVVTVKPPAYVSPVRLTGARG